MTGKDDKGIESLRTKGTEDLVGNKTDLITSWQQKAHMQQASDFLVANRLQATQIFQIMKKQLYLTKKNLFGKRITDIETTK